MVVEPLRVEMFYKFTPIQTVLKNMMPNMI